MTFPFSPALLDLVECGRRFQKPVATSKFSTPVVLLADGVVARHQSEGELLGIRLCLAHSLGTLEWNEGSRLLPSTCRLTPVPADSQYRNLFPDSVIATTLLYRDALDESVSGMRRKVLSEFTQGLEWACSAVERMGLTVMLHEAPTLPTEKVASYIR
ncbi:hypothetical protein [Piscinibacter defluvii]|uniref:hypothetical protein n=1 Tax=Piscinibacter defluvii TaxID=1796922 RepID=UPI000FDD2A6E|nr:hypothetical protein [Piscinibacter defluvii]